MYFYMEWLILKVRPSSIQWSIKIYVHTMIHVPLWHLWLQGNVDEGVSIRIDTWDVFCWLSLCIRFSLFYTLRPAIRAAIQSMRGVELTFGSDLPRALDDVSRWYVHTPTHDPHIQCMYVCVRACVSVCLSVCLRVSSSVHLSLSLYPTGHWTDREWWRWCC